MSRLAIMFDEAIAKIDDVESAVNEVHEKLNK
jgi:hypothetical protein